MPYADTASRPLVVPSHERRARPLLDIDPGTFRRCFDRRPFLIGHSLVGHPLFEVPRLLALCRSLPEDSIEYNAGNLPVSVRPECTPRNGLDAQETIRRIAECDSWLVLKYVEQDPEYRALLHRCLAEVAVHSEPIRPGMHMAQGFVFISSPGSMTPYHMDPEHNFLLQIRGSKRIHMFDGHDRTVLSEEALERFYCGGPRNMEYAGQESREGWVFDLLPGAGLHFPVTAPHYVRNGREVSISFSITFRTPDLRRRRLVHICNAHLRRHGMHPAPVGAHPWRDRIKYVVAGIVARAHRMVARTLRT